MSFQFFNLGQLTLCLMGNFFRHFLSSADFFSKSAFSKKYLKNTIRVSSSLDPVQVGQYVGPDLGPNC